MELLRWLSGAIAQWSEHLQLKQETLGLIPGSYSGLFSLLAGSATNIDGMKDRGALIQFGCYQHRYEWGEGPMVL